MGKKHFCFYKTAETGNWTPNSSVKGSGANHYPRAPALDVPGMDVIWYIIFSFFQAIFIHLNPCSAELSASSFHSFQAGIANANSSLKWRKIYFSMKNKFISYRILWLSDHILNKRWPSIEPPLCQCIMFAGNQHTRRELTYSVTWWNTRLSVNRPGSKLLYARVNLALLLVTPDSKWQRLTTSYMLVSFLQPWPLRASLSHQVRLSHFCKLDHSIHACRSSAILTSPSRLVAVLQP